MVRGVLIVGAIVVLIAAGVVEGVLSDRWGRSEDTRTAAARLAAVPATFGTWVSRDTPIDPRILDRAEAVGSVSRFYRNTATGSEVSVLLLCGPAGPIASHTPNICYAGLGFKMRGGEMKGSVPTATNGPASTYWTARFEKPGGEQPLLVSWAWGVDGTWHAAESARTEFFTHKMLYKLYVSRVPTAAEQDHRPGPDPTQEFLKDFLPEVRKVLSPNPT